MLILKFISLVLAFYFSVLNFGIIINKQALKVGNLLIQSLSIATFIFIQFKLF